MWSNASDWIPSRRMCTAPSLPRGVVTRNWQMSEQTTIGSQSSPLYSIRHGSVERDDWQRWDLPQGEAVPTSGKWLVPLTYWLEHGQALRELDIDVGVLVAPGDAAEDLKGN